MKGKKNVGAKRDRCPRGHSPILRLCCEAAAAAEGVSGRIKVTALLAAQGCCGLWVTLVASTHTVRECADAVVRCAGAFWLPLKKPYFTGAHRCADAFKLT